MEKSKFIQSMAEAMAEMEGFYMTAAKWRAMGKKLPASWKKEGDPITLAQINNNPGNLRYWPNTTILYGYASFKTAALGWEALRAQCNTTIFGTGATWPLRRSSPVNFFQFFAGQRDLTGNLLPGGYPGYAPAADNNHPTVYAEYVVRRLKEKLAPELASITIQTQIKSLLG